MRGHGPEECFVTFPPEEVNDLYGNSFNLSYEHQYQQPPLPPPKTSLESMFEAFMSLKLQTNSDLKSSINELKTQRKMFESQLIQLGQQTAQFRRSSPKFLNLINAITIRNEEVLEDCTPEMKPQKHIVDRGKGELAKEVDDRRQHSENSDDRCLNIDNSEQPHQFPSQLESSNEVPHQPYTVIIDSIEDLEDLVPIMKVQE